MDKPFAIAATALVAVGLGVGGYLALNSGSAHCSTPSIAGGSAAIGGPFELVNQHGKTVTDKEVFETKKLVYFGFTFCPDVCPLDVTRNIEAIDILSAQGHALTPVFITIDPERDTPEQLLDYAENLYPEMITLTGSKEQVDKAIKAYRVYARKNGEGEDYLMDHSTFTYLMDASGLVDFYRRDVTPEAMADKIACYL